MLIVLTVPVTHIGTFEWVPPAQFFANVGLGLLAIFISYKLYTISRKQANIASSQADISKRQTDMAEITTKLALGKPMVALVGTIKKLAQLTYHDDKTPPLNEALAEYWDAELTAIPFLPEETQEAIENLSKAAFSYYFLKGDAGELNRDDLEGNDLVEHQQLREKMKNLHLEINRLSKQALEDIYSSMKKQVALNS